VSQKSYITPQGSLRLKEELKKLLNEERPKIVQVVSWAAGNGDRSENGDYIYGKKRLREIDRRIRFLTQRIEVCEVVDPVSQTTDKIVFGATVTLEDEEGQTKRYSIVGPDEINPQAGFISFQSPLGRALLQKKEGDVVLVQTPKGEEEFSILKIEYLAIN